MTIALVGGVAVGLPPALRAAWDGLSGAINREIAIGDPGKSRLRSALIVIQMAVATVVLAGVGVSLHSLFNLRHLALGFTARHLIYGGVDVRRSGYDPEAAPAFLERMRQRVQAVPGVEAVTLASDPPMMGYSTDQMTIEGAPPPAGGRGDGHGLPRRRRALLLHARRQPASRDAYSIRGIAPGAPRSPSSTRRSRAGTSLTAIRSAVTCVA